VTTSFNKTSEFEQCQSC